MKARKPLQARQVLVRGEKLWAVALGKKTTGRKRIRVFGRTKAEAEARAADKLAELKQHGSHLGDISSAHRSLIFEWRDRLTVEQMAEAFRKFTLVNPDAPDVADAIRQYLAAHGADKRKRGERQAAPTATTFSRQHAASTRSRLNRFGETFGSRSLDSIIPGELETFITAQNGSARNYYRALHTFFAHARRHRWTATDPMTEVPRPGASTAEKTIFKPDQMKALLRAAAGMVEDVDRHEPTLALLVLGGLCGLRYSEALRLTWAQIDLEGGEIALDKLKTAKRGLRGRFVKILPAAAEWLATLTRTDSGRVVNVNDKNARRQRSRILKAAKLTHWPHNALRRSWGSYHLAAFENADLTAAQMGHTSAETTFAKYRTLARKADGLQWFALSPSAVAEVA